MQFLLLTAVLYNQKNSIVLLDEPESHMHAWLQANLYTWLNNLAIERDLQLTIATHSEVLINSIEPADMNEVVTMF